MTTNRSNAFLAAAAVAGLMTANAANAATLVDGFDITATNSQLTTTVPGAVTFADSDTFANYVNDSVVTPIATISGGVLNPGNTNPGSGINNANIANYVASEPGNPETIAFNSNQTYFGLLWGSVDAGNTVTFLEDGTVLASFTGAALESDGVGLQGYPANGSFVDFTSTIGSFNQVVLSGNDDPFETSNFAVGAQSSAVPEPAAWAMMLLGFGMIGYAMRKRSNVRTTVSYA